MFIRFLTFGFLLILTQPVLASVSREDGRAIALEAIEGAFQDDEEADEGDDNEAEEGDEEARDFGLSITHEEREGNAYLYHVVNQDGGRAIVRVDILSGAADVQFENKDLYNQRPPENRIDREDIKELAEKLLVKDFIHVRRAHTIKTELLLNGEIWVYYAFVEANNGVVYRVIIDAVNGNQLEITETNLKMVGKSLRVAR